MVCAHELSVVGDRGSVVHFSAYKVSEANDDGNAFRRLCDLIHILAILGQKLRFKQQVLGRIAGDSELGECYEVSP